MNLEKLKETKRKLEAKESLRQHGLERQREAAKIKAEISALKYRKARGILHHVRGRVGMARGRIKTFVEKEKKKSKGKKRQGFTGFDLRSITR